MSLLPLGQLQPAGWLRGQLERQRDGMAGHLDEFWPDVRDSGWLGGSAEGWERAPYWLDALVPLAFTLQDPTLMAKAHRWVNRILELQSADGWMGPTATTADRDQSADDDHDVWPRMIMLKALLQYHSATDDQRIVPAALRLCRRIKTVLERHPLRDWGRVRWADLVLSINELSQLSGEEWLPELADLVREQGFDWRVFADELPFPAKVTAAELLTFQAEADGFWMNDRYLTSHGVNIAMGLKALPVRWANTGEEELREGLQTMVRLLDDHHGQSNGFFSCDEHVAGRHPSQGSETCAVVEAMFSLETALQHWGVDGRLAERLELLAFNPLPASARVDEWGHQYVQQANQVVCHVTEDRIYTNNGPDANTFGLEPHFGCCTANRHQGWPKFAARLWMEADDGDLVALSYAPSIINTRRAGVQVRIETSGEYPFTDEVTITVTVAEPVAFGLRLRIPGWSDEPAVQVGGDALQPLDAGTVCRIAQRWDGTRTITLRLPARVRVTDRPGGAVSVQRGPLVFTLAVEEDWRRIGGELPHASWEVLPASPWNYALTGALPEGLRLERGTVGEAPFSPDGAPLRLHGFGQRVPSWSLEHGAAAAPPASPVRLDTAIEPLVLLPYGAARLRVTEFPTAE
nr:beta-L-arabinofuranosidase domain-containing protein [Microlunatus panaciterrae]